MDSTLKGDPKHVTTTTSSATKPSHATTEDPDPTLPSKPFFMSSHFSRLTPNHKTQRPQNPTDKRYQPPPSKDIHLQAKAMTVSADADSSVLLLFQSNNARYKTVKEALKDTVRKSDTELDGKKSQRKLMTAKKKAQNDAVFEAKKADLAVKSKQLKDLQQRHDVKRTAVPLRCSRSICGLQVELAHMIANFGVKIVSVDMPPFMQIHAVDCARKTHDSLENFTPKALALTLKKEFDGVYGPAWHCIVGTSFGSFVTHSVGGFFYFSMDQKLYILLFKTTVQIAD